MKRSLRISALLLCAVTLTVSVCAPRASAAEVDAAAQGADVNQRNIVAWADYYYGVKWTALSDVQGWYYTFKQGESYRIPYSQPVNTVGYIGYYRSTVERFLAATEDLSSEFYTSSSEYITTSPYYGMDCSSFVSSCWGITRRTTRSLPYAADSLGAPDAENIDKINVGDAFDSTTVGHVVLVTGIKRADGMVTEAEITEATPPQLKRTVYLRDALISKYSRYTILRYRGEVPEAPSADFGENDGLLGDANGDGVVSVLDATAVQRYLAGYSVTAPEAADRLGDANLNGRADILDATCIQRWLAGLTAPAAIGRPA